MENVVNTTLEEMIKNEHFNSHSEGFVVGRYIIQPVYWSEDEDGNINYDIESMRDEFERLLWDYEEHNENSEFNWE